MTQPSPQRPAPLIAASAKPYWDAARDGVLLVAYCAECGHLTQYGRPFCEVCLAAPMSWRPASGTGHVYSYTVIRRSRDPFFAERVPYVLGIVELDEGIRMLTEIVGLAPDDVRIGMPVRVCFEPAGDCSVPLFEPAPGTQMGASSDSWSGTNVTENSPSP